MHFPSIDIQGSILSNDLLSKIRNEQASFQQGRDFNKEFTNSKLKDEISLAWQEAKGQWVIFKSKLSRLKEGDSAVTETRNFWIIPLLTNLGYNLSFNRQLEEINGKSFQIGYRDSNLDNFPVYIGGFNESLDKRPDNKLLRVSPHAMIQEYLNFSGHLYGLVTNGRQLRLLRDASRITRLSYAEFNLEKMMEEDLYSDFVIFYRIIHASRMPSKAESGAESIIEKYHQEGLEAGSTIRNKLGEAVKGAIINLANGFINHPGNTELRKAFKEGHLNADEYYRIQLRIIYRLLFLFVIEERNLVYSENKTPETKRFAEIYYKYYSLLRLRKRAGKLPPPEANRYHDLWQSLISTFSLFERKDIGQKLGIMALQGDLFGYNAISSSHYDLHQCHLSNDVLLKVIQSLGYFENENHVLIAVNYGGLDVEEFGSVYEGLLELKLKILAVPGTEEYKFDFDTSNERGKSGSHYTPEELVQPLIKHSLEYLIEDRIQPFKEKRQTKERTVQFLLNLKIADVACGSGHILLSAARRVALEVARIQTEEEQPNPLAIRKAMKDVVRNCIYGVDKNPLAVELCKIALWLESYNPGEPLNFLDHHIKCGDAIVGLAKREELENGISTEAFKTLPNDDKEVAKTFRDRNLKERKQRDVQSLQLKTEFEKTTESSVKEAIAEYKGFILLPESTPEEIERKANAYRKFIDGKGYTFLKAMADTQVAQFFIPKTNANKDYLMTDTDFRSILSGYMGWQDRRVAKASSVALELKFFHWFIEFPEVFFEGGFHCILGNPPYLGGLRLSTNYGNPYLNYLKNNYPINGTTSDLAAYFIRRDALLIYDNGYIALITTNTISQGDTRVAGLGYLVESNFSIGFALSSVKWPGVANLNVSTFSIKKGKWINPIILNNKIEPYINSYFTSNDKVKKPKSLIQNQNLVFNGTYYLGDGFVINKEEKDQFLSFNPQNADVIFPLLIGNDINEKPDQSPSNYIINFFDWDINKAKEYIHPFNHVEKLVKPFREKNNRAVYRERWWQYGERRVGLYKKLEKLETCFVITATTKYLNFIEQQTDKIFAKSLYVLASDSYYIFTICQSTFHDFWSRLFSSTLADTLSYTPSTCFESFPIPMEVQNDIRNKVEVAGRCFHNERSGLLILLDIGLTKMFNLYHSQNLSISDIIKASKKDNLTCQKAYESILRLRDLHRKLDEVVLEAYGWNDVQLMHSFYEAEYLPENDRVRYTIHPEARKEILKRLLELNDKIHQEEVEEALLKSSQEKSTNKTKATSKSKIDSSQLSILSNQELTMKEFSLNEGIYSIKDTSEIIGISTAKVKGWFEELYKEKYEGLDSKQKSDIENMRISFHGLIELVVIGTLRDNKFSLKKILKAREDLKNVTGKIYPFATNNVKDHLKVAGKNIVFELPTGEIITLDGTSQYNIDFIKSFFKDIIFNNGIAERIMPERGKGAIVIDPKQANGKPSILDTDISIEVIKKFYRDEDSIPELIEQFPGLDKEKILVAVQYN